MRNTDTDSLHIPDYTVMADSLAQDTVPPEMALVIVKDPVPTLQVSERDVQTSVNSWIFIGLAVLFCLICFGFRNNMRSLKSMLHDIGNQRERGNLFDDPVRKGTSLILLNIMSVCECGIMLAMAVSPDMHISGHNVSVCIGFFAIYAAVIPLCYLATGKIFLDNIHTSLWLRGHFSTQAFLGILMFVPSVLLLFRSGNGLFAESLCVILFLTAKIIFLYKGLRIFFSQNIPWLIFLCYLCAVEIIPALITYTCASRFVCPG